MNEKEKFTKVMKDLESDKNNESELKDNLKGAWLNARSALYAIITLVIIIFVIIGVFLAIPFIIILVIAVVLFVLCKLMIADRNNH